MDLKILYRLTLCDFCATMKRPFNLLIYYKPNYGVRNKIILNTKSLILFWKMIMIAYFIGIERNNYCTASPFVRAILASN